MIVDNPTYESIGELLEMMTVRPCKMMWMSNREAWQRDPGTLPMYEVSYGEVIVFLGDSETLEDEFWIIKPSHIERMQNGETIRFNSKGIDMRHAPAARLDVHTAAGKELSIHNATLSGVTLRGNGTGYLR